MSDMIYRLILKARFEDEAELDRVLHGLERLQVQGANVSVNMGEMGRQGSYGLNNLARSALRVGFMFNMLESAHMRASMATVILDNAQERYNNAVAKYGVNSSEAQKAAKQLEERMKYLHMANMRANVSMGLMLTQLALQSNLLKQATLSTIAHTVATKGATVAHWLENTALKVKATLMAMVSGGTLVPVMAGAALATGAIIAGTTAHALMTTPTSRTEVNIETTLQVETNIEDALREQNRRVKNEYARSVP